MEEKIYEKTKIFEDLIMGFERAQNGSRESIFEIKAALNKIYPLMEESAQDANAKTPENLIETLRQHVDRACWIDSELMKIRTHLLGLL
ncbi:MAG: hypothetical protein EOL97_08935 [Spirochaetia bacterium]|nr:hypothetical protein [Spirochaetia bacterium]